MFSQKYQLQIKKNTQKKCLGYNMIFFKYDLSKPLSISKESLLLF